MCVTHWSPSASDIQEGEGTCPFFSSCTLESSVDKPRALVEGFTDLFVQFVLSPMGHRGKGVHEIPQTKT